MIGLGCPISVGGTVKGYNSNNFWKNNKEVRRASNDLTALPVALQATGSVAVPVANCFTNFLERSLLLIY